MQLPKNEILKDGFIEVLNSKLRPLKNIINEYVAIYLMDKYETSINGFDWFVNGNDIIIKNIKWINK